MAKAKQDATVLDAPATMKPQIVTFEIIGISPLLQNNPAAFIGKSDDESLATKKVYNDEEEAKLRLYLSPDGHFCHPCEAFIKAMQMAVKGKKFGKKSAPAIIKGSVFIVEQFALLEDAHGNPLTEYTIDRRSVVINKKSRVLRCRPCFNEWRLQLALEIDTAILEAIHVNQALSLAGRIMGVGDYRVEKGGAFGRYRVG